MNNLLDSASSPRILLVDDHPTTLSGTMVVLQQHHQSVEILVAQTAQEVFSVLAEQSVHLVILDLSIPEQAGDNARTETGISALKQLMAQYPTQNIAILSTNIKPLIRIRPEIDSHQGGFTVIDKAQSTQGLLARVDAALNGFSDTREIKGFQPGIELKPEWLEVLNLAFQEGLQDKAIAQRLGVQPTTVRHYWTKLYDVLEIYSDEERQDGKNIRTRAEILARQKGLID
ncbi:MAG: response regulator transcription factor [Leptolyngbya sp. SIO4C1]|nr:response regulator transcription factor [Leptolyngbya sp. SIO4C1]